jgi:hypothetical protein
MNLIASTRDIRCHQAIGLDDFARCEQCIDLHCLAEFADGVVHDDERVSVAPTNFTIDALIRLGLVDDVVGQEEMVSAEMILLLAGL